MDERSEFGYCEHCGLVYALSRLRVLREAEESIPPGADRGDDTGGKEGRSDVTRQEEAEGKAFRWSCGDCGTVITADTESDLGLLKREHIHEYHPNRPTV